MAIPRDNLLMLLGVPESEVTDVEETDVGVVATTLDGNRYVYVDPDGSGDAHGKTGLMFLVPPHEKYAGSFPVYADPSAGTAPAEEPAEPEPADSGDEVPDGSVGELVAWVGDDAERAERALEAERARPKPRASALHQLEAIAAEAGD